MKPKQLSRTVIYENRWVNLYVDKVEFPGGRIIEKHHVLDFETEAVAMLVENDQSQLLFVHSYRYVTDSIEWEIPAGGIDEGESIFEAAKLTILHAAWLSDSGQPNNLESSVSKAKAGKARRPALRPTTGERDNNTRVTLTAVRRMR